MNWTFRIQHKYKTAMLFMVVVIIILGCTLLESRYMSQMDNSVSSIYNDRLIPEVELFHLNDNMHVRRRVLEKYLLSPEKYEKASIASQLQLHQSRIDSIIKNYETTYLVEEESKMLVQVKQTLERYHHLETAFIGPAAGNFTSASYDQQLEPVFSQVRNELLVLSSIQTSVGKELYNGSAESRGSANALSYLQIAIVVLITLAVQALLLNSRPILPKKVQKYQWN